MKIDKQCPICNSNGYNDVTSKLCKQDEKVIYYCDSCCNITVYMDIKEFQARCRLELQEAMNKYGFYDQYHM